MITGKGAYSRFKFESGVHRVQRVPDTESSGRIHTSTATVAVLPEVEDVDVEINPADIRMEVFRASGAGGQHVNKTSSAVRLIHIPTGMVAECQTERSQVQNREYAMRLLKSRLYEEEKAKQDAEVANARKTQVGSGDRSEKIRTYNYPQGRITDHRIGLSIYQFEDFLNGNLDEMIDNLIAADRAERRRKPAGLDHSGHCPRGGSALGSIGLLVHAYPLAPTQGGDGADDHDDGRAYGTEQGTAKDGGRPV